MKVAAQRRRRENVAAMSINGFKFTLLIIAMCHENRIVRDIYLVLLETEDGVRPPTT